MKCQMACLDTDEDMLSLNGEVGGKGDLCNVFLDSQNSMFTNLSLKYEPNTGMLDWTRDVTLNHGKWRWMNLDCN